MRLEGRSAVVTGSTSGIGKAIALLLAKEGANVVINGRGNGAGGSGTNLDPLNAVVDEIKADGGNAIACAGSVSDFEFAGEMMQSCVDAFGGIDILVNNAGMPGGMSVELCPPEHWHPVIDVNLNGTYYCSHHAAKYMKEQRWGRILTCSSYAHTGYLGGSCYPASKGGIASLTRAMARSLGMWGITANGYCPEARTRMTDGNDPDQYNNMQDALLKRGFFSRAQYDHFMQLHGPEGVAPFVVYLCTEEADYINGQMFHVEGGRIGLLPEVEVIATLTRDYDKEGPWTVDELIKQVPISVGWGLKNAVPKRPAEEVEQIMSSINPMFW